MGAERIDYSTDEDYQQALQNEEQERWEHEQLVQHQKEQEYQRWLEELNSH